MQWRLLVIAAELEKDQKHELSMAIMMKNIQVFNRCSYVEEGVKKFDLTRIYLAREGRPRRKESSLFVTEVEDKPFMSRLDKIFPLLDPNID